ncbi:hypothetical protein COLU111180_05190 [Cohnella lubricantis]|uniref:Uncharacterized protein n=1 Tax=Cohnella lubricantis TaxID=2163172 RepID=A0A841TB11_9BACL|nr:hypothetical protein [Cohnella lubricantis]MBB6677276.1 hypothetical protein [Cohnella lubricantis]MBP2116912.1 hypothetical protein [Cohnella lubricantis]
MTRQYAIDLAKRLYRDNRQSYYVVEDSMTQEYRVVEKPEVEKERLNRYVIFSIEWDDDE